VRRPAGASEAEPAKPDALQARWPALHRHRPRGQGRRLFHRFRLSGDIYLTRNGIVHPDADGNLVKKLAGLLLWGTTSRRARRRARRIRSRLDQGQHHHRGEAATPTTTGTCPSTCRRRRRRGRHGGLPSDYAATSGQTTPRRPRDGLRHLARRTRSMSTTPKLARTTWTSMSSRRRFEHPPPAAASLTRRNSTAGDGIQAPTYGDMTGVTTNAGFERLIERQFDHLRRAPPARARRQSRESTQLASALPSTRRPST